MSETIGTPSSVNPLAAADLQTTKNPPDLSPPPEPPGTPGDRFALRFGMACLLLMVLVGLVNLLVTVLR